MLRAGKTAGNALPALAVVLGCAAILLSAWPRESFLLDDALIYQNFVRSALDGHGFEYSPGEAVEGYSSPLWVLLLYASGLMGATGLMAAKIIGLLCVLISACFIATSRFLRADPTVLLLTVLLFAAQPALGWYAVSGMDTPLVILLVTALVIAAIDHRPIGVAVAGGLLWISRPEGALYTLSALLWLTLHRPSGIGAPRRSAALFIICLLPGIAWQIYRLCAYGTLIANSALAKLAGSDIPAPIASAGTLWEYIHLALLDLPGVWIALVLGAVLAIPLRHAATDQRFPTRVLFASLVVAQIAFVMKVKWDWMPFSRFWLALIPVAVLWPASLLVGARSPKVWRWGVSVLTLALLATAFPQYADFTDDRRWEGAPASYTSHRAPFRDPLRVDPGALFQAFALLRFTQPGDTVMLKDVGQAGYLASDLTFMDQYGLVSRFEGEYLAGWRSDADLIEHFKKSNPSMVFVKVEWGTQTPAQMRIDAALRDTVRAGYRPIKRTQWNGPTQMVAYLRKDIPIPTGRIDLERFADWHRKAPGLKLPDPSQFKRPDLSQP
jgi:hypothetical protein